MADEREDQVGAEGAAPPGFRSPRSFATVAAILVVVLGAGVLIAVQRNRASTQAGASVTPSTTSSPFEVEPAPSGYRLSELDVPTTPRGWQFDSDVAVAPYRLFAPAGAAGGDAIAVSYYAVGGAGGIDDVLGIDRDGNYQSFLASGPPVYTSGSDWSEYTADVSPTVRVLVAASTVRTEAQLAAVAALVDAPKDPPELPTIDADRIDAIDGLATFAEAGAVDAPLLDLGTGAHVQTWVAESDPEIRLRVATVPGQTNSLDAFGRHPWDATGERTERVVNGRQVVRMSRCRGSDGWCDTSVAASTPWGDVAVVSASPEVDADVITQIVAHLRPVDDAAWDARKAEAFGGADLTPHPGATEVARGTIGDRSWMLQTVPSGRQPEATGFGSGPDGTTHQFGIEVEYGVDRCLKISDLTRACTGGSSSMNAEGESSMTGAYQPGEGSAAFDLSFVGVRGYPTEAVAVHVTGNAFPATPDRPARPAFDVQADLHDAPSGDGRFAVVPAQIGMAVCTDPVDVPAEVADAVVRSRVVLLDATGAEVACLGIG